MLRLANGSGCFGGTSVVRSFNHTGGGGVLVMEREVRVLAVFNPRLNLEVKKNRI
jgi:hypothetical protein